MILSLQKSVLSAVCGLALLFNTGAALSASSASARIDWSTFTITAFDLGSGTPSYTLLNEWTVIEAYDSSLQNWQFDYASDWTRPISASSAVANAQADSTQLLASAQTSYGQSYAYARRSATIEITGSGSLVLTADYSLDAAIGGHPGHSLDYAYPVIDLTAFFDTQDGGGMWADSSLYLELYLDRWTSVVRASESNTFALTLLVNDGDRINFTAFSRVSVLAIPVPAAVWLLGTALVGLVSVGRRRTAA